ncbi:hypothetical protein KPL37_01145 [Clostridium frigoris]|uniref:Uncharacterized protein n=1 Tax=Clostridium frigoris TaxID=205327 RepID=A0ABS6BNK9_9CLOT|nr:hypothetical protein [Clostridium frigoris]MBU3158377.1 hypothetical protein [Clostridium frigoris]
MKNLWNSNIVILSSTNYNFNVIFNLSKELILTFAPLQSVLISIGLLTFYLIVIGLLNFIINVTSKNTAVGFISIEIIIFFSLIIYKKQFLDNTLDKFTLIKNVLLQNHTFDKITAANFLNSLLFSFLYFGLISIVLKVVGLALIKRIDLDTRINN